MSTPFCTDSSIEGAHHAETTVIHDAGVDHLPPYVLTDEGARGREEVLRGERHNRAWHLCAQGKREIDVALTGVDLGTMPSRDFVERAPSAGLLSTLEALWEN